VRTVKMTRRILLAASLCVAVLMTVSVTDAAKEKNPLKGVKCFLKKTKDGKGIPVKKALAVDYKGGKVYFCCGGCKNKFSKDAKCREANAHKANHQLAATGQATLKKCVFSGGKLNPATKIKVNGVTICFCCNMCKGKVLKAKDKVALAFSDKAFAKGYVVAK
jgi:YHS domain-containing protein